MLTLLFGQCGNQLGHELFTKIANDIQCQCPGLSFSDSHDYIESSNKKWFGDSMKNGKNSARAILIDTERKVIDKIRNKHNNGWCFMPDNIITPGTTGGSANNWSFGYLHKGPEFVNPILEVVRKELEKIDRLDTFLCLLSCAGGTGSGIGSYIIQTLRDTFPTKNIIGTLAVPFGFGEVATQNYNTVLSLARIIDDTDMIIVLENEQLHKELMILNNINESKSLNEINFPGDINDIACRKLLSVFQPATDITNKYNNNTNYIISKIVPHPAYKLTTIEAVPVLSDNKNLSQSSWQPYNNSDKWESHFKLLKRNLHINHFNNYLKSYRNNNDNNQSVLVNNCNNIRSLANILITRGSSELNGINHSDNNNFHQFSHNYFNHNDIYSKINWLSSSDRYTHLHQRHTLLNNKKFTSIITNNSRITKSLDDIINKAWNSYTYGAYLHQYKIHGLDDDDFLRAFAKINNLNSNYKNLLK